MEAFLSLFYFLVAAALLCIIKCQTPKVGRKYSKNLLLTYEHLNVAPPGFSPVETFRGTFAARTTRFKNKGKPAADGKNTSANDRETRNTKEIQEKKPSLIQKTFQVENKENVYQSQASLSSFILKELENSVKELTNSKTKPVAPSGYSLNSISSSNRGQTPRLLNAGAQEYTIRRIH